MVFQGGKAKEGRKYICPVLNAPVFDLWYFLEPSFGMGNVGRHIVRKRGYWAEIIQAIDETSA